MTSTRRIGTESSATRTALLDAAQQVLLEEGYAAATSRRVAARAGLKPQLVHYYFRTMDHLFLALVRRGAEQNLERQAEALASPEPLRALWELSSDPAGTALTMEFAALANHRKAIRAELASYGERFRRLQTEALTQIFERYGIDANTYPPAAMIVTMTSLSQVMGMEQLLGMTAGHAETRELIEGFLSRYEHASAGSALTSPGGSPGNSHRRNRYSAGLPMMPGP
ncbi:MAG: TetR/AcrR family transcriptional regulator [Acidimicrobiales bacterium]